MALPGDSIVVGVPGRYIRAAEKKDGGHKHWGVCRFTRAVSFRGLVSTYQERVLRTFVECEGRANIQETEKTRSGELRRHTGITVEIENLTRNSHSYLVSPPESKLSLFVHLSPRYYTRAILLDNSAATRLQLEHGRCQDFAGCKSRFGSS